MAVMDSRAADNDICLVVHNCQSYFSKLLSTCISSSSQDVIIYVWDIYRKYIYIHIHIYRWLLQLNTVITKQDKKKKKEGEKFQHLYLEGFENNKVEGKKIHELSSDSILLKMFSVHIWFQNGSKFVSHILLLKYSLREIYFWWQIGEIPLSQQPIVN